MTGAEQILVIILSSFLTLFLILGSIALVLFIQVLRAAKRVSQKADDLVGKATSLSLLFERSAGPVAIIKTVVGIVEQLLGRRSASSNSKRKG